MELIKFALTSFWTWAGTLTLISATVWAIGEAAERVAKAFRSRKRTVKISRMGEEVIIYISNAGQDDVDRIIQICDAKNVEGGHTQYAGR